MSLSSSFVAPAPQIIGSRSSPPVYSPGFPLQLPRVSLFLYPSSLGPPHLHHKATTKNIVASMTTRGADFETNADDDEEEYAYIEDEELDADPFLPERWDVVGLGQAMVDFSGMVDDEFLGKLDLEKGTRKLVNHEERGRVLRAMDGCSYKAAAGGSLSNSLVALARLGSTSIGGSPLSVAMTGSVGSDPLGGFYRAKLRRANLHFLSPPIKDGTTGTVIVLTSSDTHRTMLAYQGTSSTVNYDSCLASAVCNTKILVVEGYLFELPDTIKTITKACEEARRCGALVAVTASDVSCIERHYDDFWEIVGNYADIVFANSDEARAFCHFSSKESPISATRYLSHFVPFASVTDGPRGSYIGVKGEAVYIPPSPCVPVDTCGAGDAYASGILFGILRGVSDLKGIGTLAARVASTVVGQQGTRLRVQDAVELAESFTFHLDSSTIRSDIGEGAGCTSRRRQRRNLVFTKGTLGQGFQNHTLILEKLMRTGDAVFCGKTSALISGPYCIPFVVNLLDVIFARALPHINELDGTTRRHFDRIPLTAAISYGSPSCCINAEAFEF